MRSIHLQVSIPNPCFQEFLSAICHKQASLGDEQPIAEKEEDLKVLQNTCRPEINLIRFLPEPCLAFAATYNICCSLCVSSGSFVSSLCFCQFTHFRTGHFQSFSPIAVLGARFQRSPITGRPGCMMPRDLESEPF